MEDAGSEVPDSPPELEREPKKRAPRKKPDLNNVSPKEITIKTKTGEKTFAARSKPKRKPGLTLPSGRRPTRIAH